MEMAKKLMLAAVFAAIFMPAISVCAMGAGQGGQEDSSFAKASADRVKAAVAGIADATTAVLHRAVNDGNLAGVLQYLESGRNPNILDDEGYTPFERACAAVGLHDQENIVKALYLAGGRGQSGRAFDFEPLGIDALTGIVSGHRALRDNIKAFSENPNILDESLGNAHAIPEVLVTLVKGYTDGPLDRHLLQGRGESVFSGEQLFTYNYALLARQLLAANADTEVQDEGGRTPLQGAVQYGKEGVMKLLLAAKANAEVKDWRGRTLLSWAVLDGKEGVVKLLLAARADIEAQDSDGMTPLQEAVMDGATRVEGATKLLLEARADTEVTNGHGRTPLSWAVEGGKVGAMGLTKLLLEANADIGVKGLGDLTLLQTAMMFTSARGSVKLLLAARADTEEKDGHGCTPLHVAARSGREGTVKLLLAANANTEAKDRQGSTPLQEAIKDGHKGVVRLLLAANANAEAKDSNGATPLYGSGKEDTVQLLLAAKADTEATDRTGVIPLSVAVQAREEGVIKLLKDAERERIASVVLEAQAQLSCAVL